MTPTEITSVTLQVAERVGPVVAREPVRVDTGGLTFEFQPEPYPVVHDAFAEYCRITGTDGTLVRYTVGRDVNSGKALVTAAIAVGEVTHTVTGVGPDVVSAAVDAFVAVPR